MEDTKAKLILILQKYTFNKAVWDHATDSSHLIKDLKINSARMVDIILDIEEEFGISVNDDAIEKIQTIRDVVKEVESLKQ